MSRTHYEHSNGSSATLQGDRHSYDANANLKNAEPIRIIPHPDTTQQTNSKLNIIGDTTMNAKRLFLGLLTATVVLAPLATLKPASAGDPLSPEGRAKAHSKAVQDPHYQQLGQRILKAKSTAEKQQLNQERESIKRRYEHEQGIQERASKLVPAKRLPRPHR